jgi:hypothetical protein
VRTLRSLVLACVVAVTPGAALAFPITFAFTGTVTDDPFGLSSFGAPISGTFTFESTAVDTIPGPATGSYTSSGASFHFDANVDGTPFSIVGATTINVANNIAGVDQYGVIAIDGGLTLELFFQDASGSGLSSDALPLLAPNTGAFAFRQFRLFSDDAEFLGDVTSLVCSSGCTVQQVPEPEPLSLLAIGAVFALLRNARLRRRAKR